MLHAQRRFSLETDLKEGQITVEKPGKHGTKITAHESCG